MSFYLFLPSNVSKGYFPSNRISSFQVKLPKRIKFSPNEYEIALTEFTYVHSMKTFMNENDRFFQYSIRFNENTEAVHNRVGYLPNINYSNINNLIKEMNKAFLHEDGRSLVAFKVSKSTGRVNITVNVARVILSEKLCENLGGFAEGNILHEGMHEALGPYEPLGGMYHIFVYSDIVKPQIVGDSLVPLLRMVNITGTEGDIVTQTFRPYYLPINKLEFDTIEILLCNEFGQEVLFDRGNCAVTLHFRKIK